MMENQIALNMYNLLIEHNRTCVWYGDIHLIEECAKKSNIIKRHPQLTIQTVLNALDSSPLFEKGYIYCDISGKVRKYRCFSVKSNFK